MQNQKLFLIPHQFSILSQCLASQWIALNTCFVSLSRLICSSSMNSSLHNGCDSPVPSVYNTGLIKRISGYIWYHPWQVFSVFSDEDWKRQNLCKDSAQEALIIISQTGNSLFREDSSMRKRNHRHRWRWGLGKRRRCESFWWCAADVTWTN